MSFGGFGGFGSNNNTQQSSGFGFGSNNNTSNTGGFGSTGFGSNTNTSGGGGLFGSSNTGGGFGSGGFGSNTNTSSPFGQKPGGFGTTASTSGGLFGSNTATSSGGGFGGFGSNTNQSSGFGSTSTSLFGGAKPATGFGASTTGTSGLFGNTGASTGFGGGATSSFGQGTTSSFGGALGNAQCPGTDSIPFQPVNEKETGTGGQIVYQTITTMDQYKNWSFEELRVADYLKGKRFGTTNGQAGAFGQTTGFGGFGANNNTASSGFGTSGTTGGGLFGASNNTTSNTTSAFGGGQTSSGFGGTGNLFGQNKPAAGGGLFGNSATSAAPSGGLFGAAANNTTSTTGGFGSGNTGFGGGAAGGGLFGQNNQTQNKGFGGFGSTNTATTSAFGGGGFGSTNNTGNTAAAGGGLFGNNAANNTSSLFGGNTQQNSTSAPATSAFGGFGQNQQQNQTQQPGGGLFGGGGFGANNNNNTQQQGGGLFGNKPAAPATGGLFGQNNTTNNQQAGGLFGQNNQQQQGGGLFGNKPAAPGGGLFGNSQPAANTGGGLFGTQTQQNQGGGLFGQNNQNQNKGLFGNSSNTGGGSLFGGLGQNNQQNNGGGFFANSQQNQQQGTNQAAQSQSVNLFASLDHNPYGNDQLFQNLETPAASVGPIATPLSSSQKVKRNAILPQHKLNPAASTRLITPQKRPPPGFGFSYSTYGTPGSANPSPAGGLFNSSNFNRSLGKSFSTSNLRGGYDNADSILAPGAFSPTPRAGYAAGSLKRLTIDRNVNTRGLFNGGDANGAIAPSPLKKTVSFDANANGVNGSAKPSSSKAIVRVESDDGPAQDDSTHLNGKTNGTVNGTSKGKELATVPEGSSSTVNRSGLPDMKDKPAGEYWMKPSLSELRKMTPQQLKKVEGFTVGRENVGKIEYEVPVDLSNLNLEQIPGQIVKIGIRNASTYGEDCPIPKPPVGRGLNVRSIITLENSWPRAKAGSLPVHEKKGPRFEKHIQRLKRVPDTEFLSYDENTGVWRFRVEHYTTYGLDYEDDGLSAGDETMDMTSSVLSDARDVPTPTPGAHATEQLTEDLTLSSTSSSGLDDTFQFQKQKRKNVPGGFGDDTIYEDEQTSDEDQDATLDNTQSFLGERSVGSVSEDDTPTEDVEFEDESGSVDDQDMAGSFPVPNHTTEQPFSATNVFNPSASAFQPKSILKASVARRSVVDTPSKGSLDLEEDWAEQLQRTVSPKKRDRQALRESQGTALKARDNEMQKLFKSTINDKPITNSIDLMQSIWGAPAGVQAAAKTKPKRMVQELQFPYSKRPKTHEEKWSETDKAFHQSCKPRWCSDGTLIYVTTGNATNVNEGPIRDIKRPIVSEHLDTHFARLVTPQEAISETLATQKSLTESRTDENEIPYVFVRGNFKFSDFAHKVSLETPASTYEHKVWELASILFDPIEDLPDDFPLPHTKEHELRFRKERLSQFWQMLVQPDADHDAQSAKSAEAKAIAHVSGHNIADACDALVSGRDYKLATMVAQLGGSDQVREDMAKQLDSWRNDNTLSEISEPIRALYELVSGNCAVCEGNDVAGSENSADTFKLASKFNLDWRRAFGLRLWYGVLPEEDIGMAVAQYESDVSEGREGVKPVPWFVEKKVDRGWNDPTPDEREDILWGLLKLYASQQMEHIDINVADIFAPASVSGNPVDARLSWQLIHLFRARRDIKLPARLYEEREFQDSTSSNPSTGAQEDALYSILDELTITYAATLETPANWITSIWIYTYLSDPRLRAEHIKRVLSLHASAFEIPETPNGAASLPANIPSNTELSPSAIYEVLTSKFKIPAPWLHNAKALFARSILQAPSLVLHHLLAARDFVTAHHVLCTEVAPAAIIARDYDTLREVLGGFDVQIGKKTGRDLVQSSSIGQEREWALGGQVYFDFIHAFDIQNVAAQRQELSGILFRLLGSLAAVGKRYVAAPKSGENEASKASLSLVERAAIQEMSRQVAEWLEDGKVTLGSGFAADLKRTAVLTLPLGESGCGVEATRLAREYFDRMLSGDVFAGL